MNEMESVDCSLKQMGDNVSALQVAAVPGLASWGQDKLNECKDRWDLLSKQVRKEIPPVCIVCCYVLQIHIYKNYGFLLCVYVGLSYSSHCEFRQCCLFA